MPTLHSIRLKPSASGRRIFKQAALLSALWTALLPSAYAYDLQDILKKSLQSDPTVLEAKANEEAAKSTVKATKAGHYPVLSLTGVQVLVDEHKSNQDDMDGGLGVRGNLNLYSWGGIEASVRRDKSKSEYFHYKYFETQEQLGGEIGRLYLSALRAKDLLQINRQSLVRHNNLLKDLNVIVKYDAGRRSELIEARARQLEVQSAIVQQTRAMELALSRLSLYTQTKLTAEDLQDPFRNYRAAMLVAEFHNPDQNLNPSYRAQLAEQNSVREEWKVSKSRRLPSINLEGSANRSRKQLYVNLSWDIFDMASRHNVEKNAQNLIAAEAKSEQIVRDAREKGQTAEIDMQQSEQRADLSAQHIAAQKDVVKTYELQFKIARRTLTDVLGAYNELSRIEQEHVTARNDFRDAALTYLVTQSQIANWAGVHAENQDEAAAETP
ncbi:TolC family protein [Neisseria lisongii]|uniref:TolC family protein n=1 Tax=Neisseria lisongii TaxID=2912188 RepID=A0AAW5AD80_9NEIS|nr:TolC family protein [Neisseria lisongii]MCF7528793.1 TolC family protein [Neisseria lisongii]MCF7529651.1 TolC family protein [Neisseria lisongii]